MRRQWSIVDAQGTLWPPYTRANVWRDWGAEATTTFGIDQVPLIEQATWLEVAGGSTTGVGPNLNLYAQAGYQFAISDLNVGTRRNGVAGDFGFGEWRADARGRYELVCLRFAIHPANHPITNPIADS